MTTSTPARRWLMCALVASLAVAACGRSNATDREGETTSTTAHAGSAPSTSADPSTTAGPSAPTTPPLSAGASVEQIVAAAEDVLGPTGDIVAELSPFVGLPADIPTPENAEIVDFSVRIDPSDQYPTSDSSVSLTTSASLDDIATFYDVKLVSAGYLPSGNSDSTDGGAPSRSLEFDVPGYTGVYDGYYKIVVSISAAIDGAESGASVRLQVIDTARDGNLGHLDAWPGKLPGVESPQSELTSLSTSTSMRGTSVLRLQNRYVVEGSPSRIAEAFRADLPTDLYARLAKGPEGATDVDQIEVSRDGFESVTLHFGPGIIAGSNTTSITVNAEVPFRRPSEPDGGEPADDGAAVTSPTTASSPPAPPEPTTGTAAPAEPIPDDAGVDQIAAAANQVLGPSDDLAAAVSPLGELPADIPTPLGADVFAFDLATSERGEQDRLTVYFTTSATHADAETFYATKMTAAGYALLDEADDLQGGKEQRTLRFDDPSADPDCGSCTVEVRINDGPADDGWPERDWIELEVVGPASGAELNRLDAWPGVLPGVRSPKPVAARVIRRDTDAWGDLLDLHVSYRVAGSPAEIIEQVRAALPSDVYRPARDEYPEEGIIKVRREGFSDVRLAISESGEAGTASVSVQGAIELRPPPSEAPIGKPPWWDDVPVPDEVSAVKRFPALEAELGLTPSKAYAEFRLTDLPATDLLATYYPALEAEGFDFLIEQDGPIGVTVNAYTPPAGRAQLIVGAIAPEAFDDDDLAHLADAVPDGKTVVMVAAIED